MTTYNTDNPLGSVDVRDLYDNAQNLDNFANGPLNFYADRLGVSRESLQGIRNATQYQIIGTYGAGLNFTSYNQVFSYLGEFYAPSAGLTLPYTTTGAGAGEIASFRSVGDAVLRSDLNGGIIRVNSISDLLQIPPKFESQAMVSSYHAELEGGGGMFKWDESKDKALHDGGTAIDPDVVFPTDWANPSQVATWFTAAASGTGCWVRIYSGPVNALWFGADKTGATDSVKSFQQANDKFASITADFGSYRFNSGLLVGYRRDIDFNGASIFMHSTGYALDLANVLYTVVRNVGIYLEVDSAKALRVHSPNEAATMSQLNKFYNVNIEGNLRPGTECLFLSNTFTNQFYSCNFFRAEICVLFGEVGAVSNSCNANHFYGCEVRGVNTSTYTGVIHNNGDNNAFFGGVIENLNLGVVMKEGSFLLHGVYLEGFSADYGIVQEGGTLDIDSCFRLSATKITGGKSFSLRGNHFVASANYTKSYPFIRVIGNIGTIVNIDASVSPSEVFVIRENQYYAGDDVWLPRTAGYDKVQWVKSDFSVRLASDRIDATGDGTVYTIVFGNNKEFDNLSELNTGDGIFYPKTGGRFLFTASVYVSGLVAGNVVYLRIVTTDRTYHISSKAYVAGEFIPATGLVLSGSCYAEVGIDEAARVEIVVSGGAKVVDILRGDAVNGYTTFTGHKV